MKQNKLSKYIEKTTNIFEIVIAILLLIVIAIKIIDMNFELTGVDIRILIMDFERILAIIFNLVIGVEFIKMLCRHTPETVIDVLLFTIARQMVLSHEKTIDIFIGVLAIGVMFAIKKYLADKNFDKK